MDAEKRIKPENIALAALTYAAGFVYIQYIFSSSGTHILLFGVFAALFVALTELAFRGRKRAGESWIWLGCALLITLCRVLGRENVWSAEASEAFAHVFFVWWLLSRGGLLLAQESGRLLPLDALDGFVLIPFGSFFLRARTLGGALGGGRKDGGDKSAAVGAALCLLAAAGLLWLTADTLAGSDQGFDRLLGSLRLWEQPNVGELVAKLLLSLPVGAWLCGLILGGAQQQRERLDRRAAEADALLERLRIVPTGLWSAVIAVFSLLYLAYFAVQGSYLFGAFARRLPEGFIVSQYAREGFFELCRVMVLNFTLLWLVTRTSRARVRENRLCRLACTALLIAGLLFAVIALSKLALYISCFGFTPRRLESTWLATVLLMGSAAAIHSLWSGKKSFRAWMIFGAVTLSLLHLL